MSQRQSAAPGALLLGYHRKPVDLHVGKEPILICQEFLSGFTVHMGLAGSLIRERVEDEIRAGSLSSLPACHVSVRGSALTSFASPWRNDSTSASIPGLAFNCRRKREVSAHGFARLCSCVGLCHAVLFFGRRSETIRFPVIGEIVLSSRSDKLERLL